METLEMFVILSLGLIAVLCFVVLFLSIRNNSLLKELEAENQKAKTLLDAVNESQNISRSMANRLREILDLHPELRTEEEKILHKMNNKPLDFINRIH